MCYTAKSELRKSYGWSGVWKSGRLRAIGPGNRPVSHRRPSQRREISAPEDEDSQRFTNVTSPGRVARLTCSIPPTALDVWLVSPAPSLPLHLSGHGYTVRLVSSYPATRDSAIFYGQHRAGEGRVHSVNGRQTRGQSEPGPLN